MNGVFILVSTAVFEVGDKQWPKLSYTSDDLARNDSNVDDNNNWIEEFVALIVIGY